MIAINKMFKISQKLLFTTKPNKNDIQIKFIVENVLLVQKIAHNMRFNHAIVIIPVNDI